MPRLILNYSDCILDSQVKDYYWGHEGGYREEEWQLHPEDLPLPAGYQQFYRERGICPFCQISSINKVFDEHMVDEYRNQLDKLSIWVCCNCGWWASEAHYNYENDWTSKTDHFFRDSVAYGILRKFESSDLDLPIHVLLSELSKDKSVLYEVHPTKFEQLAQYVFSSFYHCQVEHVGKSHDGGIDLILIQKDDPVLVQVKRRSKKNSVESVSTVREFLGAMFVEKSRSGIVLSTAQSFSKPSQKVIKQLLYDGRLESFQLIDFSKFCAILDVVYKDQPTTWEFMIEKWKKEGSRDMRRLLPNKANSADAKSRAAD